MKRILILCPLTQSESEWAKVAAVRARYFDSGEQVTDLHETIEMYDKLFQSQPNLQPLVMMVPFLFDSCDEVLLMPNWKESKECKALEAIARLYGIPVRAAISADQSNFAIRKFGDLCPMQYMVDDEPARVSETQCKPCQYCFSANRDKESVICKLANGL